MTYPRSLARAHAACAPLALPLLALSLAGARPAAAAEAPSASANPFVGARLYVNPGSEARRQADAWRRSRPADAALMERIAQQPEVLWMGDWNRDVRGDVDRAVGTIRRAGALPVLVAYNIPARDCGSHSAGGAGGAAGYRKWIRGFAEGLRGRRAVVILEPDALAGMDCLKPAQREERTALLRGAVAVLKAAGAAVYLDAGHARWISADEMASRLRRAGITQAAGFSLNVSNFLPTSANVAYGEQLSRRVGGKHFVVDTSRNGVGGNGEWCNPQGQALGELPTTRTGHPLADAFLWIKRPGESDGTCNGGPGAGAWWAEYAVGLARRQPVKLAMAN